MTGMSSGFGLLAYKDGSRLIVSRKYDSANDLWIVMDHYGSNRLISFLEWRLAPNTEPAPNPDFGRPTLLMQGEGSDWIGPYIAEAASGPDDCRKTFTGGNHAFDGNTGGTATAKTVHCDVLADGTGIPERTAVLCETVILRTVNEVQGFNTKEEDGSGRAVMRETVTYSFHAGAVRIDNRIEMLEDVIMHRYYGLQTVNRAWNGTVQYGSAERLYGEAYPVNGDSDSGEGLGQRRTDRIRIRSRDRVHTVEAILDRSSGLGRTEWVADSLPIAFSKAYGKSYFNLVHGPSPRFGQGDTLEWTGTYRFYRTDEQSDTEVSGGYR
ncbi:hypothetical protein [Paenibacillus mesophilus]|uniref:hypothetical protein n=1 Tax=Paenibacillus mesophilus TaxID=2582849 RepID=UPI00192E70C1|nr:hypothetical protein [Paenibacillus mesophilus]